MIATETLNGGSLHAQVRCDDLLACPFCGTPASFTDQSKAQEIVAMRAAEKKWPHIPQPFGNIPSWDYHTLVIGCKNCEITFREYLCDAMSPFSQSDVVEARNRVIAKWQRRQANGEVSHRSGPVAT